MNPSIFQPGVNASISLSIVDLLLGMSVALVISLAIVLVYRFTHRGFNYERSFLVTLAMISPIVALVMMMIGSSLSLSLGMVGALSIIRFRNVIKDSRDMVYLFWAIAVGLGSGTYNSSATLVASVFLAVALGALHFLKFGKALHSDYVLVVSGDKEAPSEKIKTVVKNYVNYTQLRSYDFKPTHWEMVMEIRMFKNNPLKENSLMSDLKQVEGVRQISILAPQLALPM